MQACEPKCNLPVLIALWGRKVVTFPWTSYGVGSLLPSPQRTGRLHEILLAWLIAKAYCSAVVERSRARRAGIADWLFYA